MWVALAVLAVLHFCPASVCGAAKEGRPDTMRQRMSQMRERMGSRGDTGRGAWVKEKGNKQKEGRKRGPKTSE